ncbi:MAG: DUF3127 domain-containing protein [Prevotella sp.]|nr:DUF3127 domain-containing protein [Prevotella sp.]
MEIQGKIIAVLPERSGSSARGEWKVGSYVLETMEAYPKKMMFEVFGEDRMRRFNIQEGQEVQVFFDIDAHEYQGRWFNSFRAYDVRPVMAGQPQVNEDSRLEPFPPAQDTSANVLGSVTPF